MRLIQLLTLAPTIFLANVMQLTKFSDLALRLLMHIAVVEQARVTTREIAERHGVSLNHLSKVAQWLTANGYVDGARGRTGGIRLAKTPSEISLGDILRKSEADIPMVECLRADGGACLLTAHCGLAPILLEAREAYFAVLDDHTLQDAIDRRPGLAGWLAAEERAQK